MPAFQLTVDANDPESQALFWADLLGYELTPPPEGFETWKDFYLSLGEPPESFPEGATGADRLRDPEGRGPSIWFQIVPEDEIKDPATKNRLHLDVRISRAGMSVEEARAAITAKVEELGARGATLLRTSDATGSGGDYFYAVLQDPEGNEFCLN